MKFKDQVKSRLERVKQDLELAKNGMEKKTITAEFVFESIKKSIQLLEDSISFINRE